jgi:hypothetical protein
MRFVPSLQSFIDNVAFWGLTVGVPALLTYLKVQGKMTTVADLALYALTAAAAVAILFAVIREHTARPPRPDPVTLETFDRRVEAWLRSLNWNFHRVDDSNAYFNIEVQMPNGQAFNIARPRGVDSGTVRVGAGVSVNAIHKDKMAKLSPSGKAEFSRELHAALIALRTEYNHAPIPFDRLLVSKTIFVRPDYSEADLAMIAMEVVMAKALVIDLVQARFPPKP